MIHVCVKVAVRPSGLKAASAALSHMRDLSATYQWLIRGVYELCVVVGEHHSTHTNLFFPCGLFQTDGLLRPLIWRLQRPAARQQLPLGSVALQDCLDQHKRKHTSETSSSPSIEDSE